MRKSTPPYPLRKNFATLAARGARAEPTARSGRPSCEPLCATSAFAFASLEHWEPALSGGEGYAYARLGHPNGDSLASAVAALEGAEAGLATASGTAALVCAVLVSTAPGDRILCQRDAYGGSRSLLEGELRQLGREVELVDAYEPSKVADGLARGAHFVLVETLSNPLLREVDVAALNWHCRSYGATLCVDNTLATPMLQRPLGLGADLVLHSATKFLGGHHDCTAGVLVGDLGRVGQARALAGRLGVQVSPFDAWQCARGLKTLHLRVERAEQNARILAERLKGHPAVQKLHYPDWGALLSLDLGSREAAERFVAAAAAEFPLIPSFGGVETSLSHPASSSHRALDPEERAQLDIGPGLLRVSLGIEDAEDLWLGVQRALSCT